ncbi:primosomal protein N' [Myxococcota bacterium]|nr:primosomal protein N' [Myxococcota bacterium]
MNDAAGEVVEIAVPVAVRRAFHYAWPAALGVAEVGARVRVPFGSSQLVAYVVGRRAIPPEGVRLATVLERLDPPGAPTFSEAALGFVRWLAEYYRAPLGEALRAAHPSAANVQFERALVRTPAGRDALSVAGDLSAAARDVLTRLGEAPVALEALAPAPSPSLIRKLADAGLVERTHVVAAPRVAVKTERCVTAVAPPMPGAAGRTRKRDALLAWLIGRGPVAVREVREAFPQAAAHLRALLDEGRVVETFAEVLRDPFFGEPVVRDTPPALTSAQRQAVAAISEASGFEGFLLHGITGSGKTEVYLHAIERCLASGRGALVLVPEIALTPQLVRRFRARLGDALAVMHSGLSDAARFDQWRRLRRGDVRIAIGARSAIFAPVEALGLIIVDEEHDPSYKQGDGVRYQARDMALLRGHRERAAVVLGSATPSLESTHNAAVGKLRRLVLAERPTGGHLPDVELVDLRLDRPPRDAAPFLSVPLRNALAHALGRGEQSILFLNRRGFSNYVQCRTCGHVPECEHCAVALTWHRGPQLLRCHYCDAVRAMPGQCPECRRGELGLPGHGTERVEEALRALFPAARVARLDRDTATGRGLASVLEAMRDGRIDILVGTQMVTKGHDFPAVTLVGVLAADAGLAFPDFRAAERTFQLLAQVAGRAGRGQRAGRVLVQTWNPAVPCLEAVRRHDHAAFAAQELELRRALGYPPFEHAVGVRLDAREPEVVEQVARALAERLRAEMAGPAGEGVRLRGPAPAPLLRLRGRTRWALLLTALRRDRLRALLDACEPTAFPRPADVRIIVDVDPQDFL